MRVPIWLTAVTAVVVLGVVLVIGQFIVKPNLPLITEAKFSPETISPNADGTDDVTVFSYSLSRKALVTLTFERADGKTFAFRENEHRSPGDYGVQFSGVVDGYTLPDEQIASTVLRRLIPDGHYTWRLRAVDQDTSETAEKTGTLTVQNADVPLPDMTTFTVAPQIFTPNQDGISDRTSINVYLTKAADLTVYLKTPDGSRIFIPERQEGRKLGEAGRHLFDYEGGVDQGADPPPDGEYTVVAEAQDAEGQRTQRMATLTLQNGGLPLADIAPQAVGVDVVFDVKPYDFRYASTRETLGLLAAPPDDPQKLSLTTIQMPVGDMLVFKLTVDNYSNVPIRTSGPPPGTVYDQEQRAASLGWFEEAGTWRVGIDCTTAASDYPWRWAIGADSDLIAQVDPDNGNTYHYLPPGKQAVVWGAIRMTQIEDRNPQDCWAGLIHEQVEISPVNQNVGTREVELIDLASSPQK